MEVKSPTQIYWVDPDLRQTLEGIFIVYAVDSVRSENHCLLAETDKEITTV